MDGGLAGWVHLGAGLNDITHDCGPDLVGMEPGACDGGLDRYGAEIGRGYFLQAAAKGSVVIHPRCRQILAKHI
jgi:hypothetical protein